MSLGTVNFEVERAYLHAELAELDRLIADCGPDEELTRISFEARRAKVEGELRQLVTREEEIVGPLE